MNEITLTPAEITELLSGARDRGGYERYLRKFVESGKLGEDVMLAFPGKERDSVYNSLNSNIKKLEDAPELQLVKKTVDGENGSKSEHLFLINKTAFEAAQNNEDSNDEDSE
jgi:hypothetical protein